MKDEDKNATYIIDVPEPVGSPAVLFIRVSNLPLRVVHSLLIAIIKEGLSWVQQLSISDVDCPELFSSTEDEISYLKILGDLEQRYSEVKEPLRICGLSLGALLAIDFAIRHEEKVASMVLIGAQYKVPSLLIDFQNLIFRCMPNKAFESMGLSKSSTIKLAHSMRSLDFTSQLNNIRCPVTILCGKKDTANLKASKRLKELLPQATLHIVPNAGHELNWYGLETSQDRTI